MYSTRREALRSFALLGGGFFFSGALSACAAESEPDGEGSVDRSENELVTCKPPAISANHGHSLVVSPADVAAGRAKTYSILGTSRHDHTVTLSAANFASLAAGGAVTVTSSNGAGHTHTVTVTCIVSTPPAPATCGNGAKASAISANHGHSLIVSKADVATGSPKTYSIQGSSSHGHQVSITAAQFTTLKTGASINVLSSSALSHTHTVTVICA